MRYVYSVVRFVPDPGRGERINVGLVVGSDEAHEWEFRPIENLKRARQLGGSVIPIATFGDWIARQFDAYAESQEDPDSAPMSEPNETWLNELSSGQRGVVQLSRPATVSAAGMDSALEMLSQELLIDPETLGLTYLRRTRPLGELRDAYRYSEDPQLRAHVAEKVDILIADTLHQRMDFAVVNGRPLQLAHAWSFQTPDQEALSGRLRAWAWSIKRLRDDGASLRLPTGKLLQVSRNIEVDVVVVPPRVDQSDTAAFAEGQDAFRRLDVIENSLDEVPSVIERASALLAA
jgi:hypothetical protein